MTLYEQEIAEGVVCTGRTADVRPNTARGTVQGAATYSFQNTSGQARKIAFGINPGYEIQSARANGEDVPVVRTGYEGATWPLWRSRSPRTKPWSWSWNTAASRRTGT